jgi:hypothetical protein
MSEQQVVVVDTTMIPSIMDDTGESIIEQNEIIQEINEEYLYDTNNDLTDVQKV